VATLGVIGTGLIGGSIGLAARSRGWTVLGHDADASAATLALSAGALDEIAERDAIYRGCAIIAIAAPVQATLDEVRALSGRALGSEQLVLDTASVKGAIALAGAGVSAFVPTHPMAGSERSGAVAARADLFSERTWCVVPTADDERTRRACAFVAQIGARPLTISAEEHDRTVALTSHLPQLFAFAFARRVAERSSRGEEIEALCGPAGKELLRLGRSSPALWEEIFRANAPALGAELDWMYRELFEGPRSKH